MGRCPLHCARFPRGSEAGIEQYEQGVRNAYCTIATTSDANGGCFSNRTSSLLEFLCYLRFSKTTALKIRFQLVTYSPESFATEADHKNLSWQSWGFQERLLSRRIIHFGSRFLFFECNTHIASEDMPRGQPFRQKQWVWERRKRKNLSFKAMLSTQSSIQQLDTGASCTNFEPTDPQH